MPNVATRRLLSVALLVTASAALAFAAARQTTQPAPGITRTQILDNARVSVAHLVLAPAARETPHTHPFDAVVVQLKPGKVEMTIGEERTSDQREAGYVWYVARNVSHAAANVGNTPLEVITVAVK